MVIHHSSLKGLVTQKMFPSHDVTMYFLYFYRWQWCFPYSFIFSLPLNTFIDPLLIYMTVVLLKWMILIIERPIRLWPFAHWCTLPRIILCIHPANERWCYIVTSSTIGWSHTQNDPWLHDIIFGFSTRWFPVLVYCCICTQAQIGHKIVLISPMGIPVLMRHLYVFVCLAVS